MRPFTLIVIITVAACAVFEWYIGPGMFLIGGFAVLALLLILQGGMAEGNPYKRMSITGAPDFLEVGTYMKEAKEEKDDGADVQVTVAFFLLGAGLIAADLIVMWYIGWL